MIDAERATCARATDHRGRAHEAADQADLAAAPGLHDRRRLPDPGGRHPAQRAGRARRAGTQDRADVEGDAGRGRRQRARQRRIYDDMFYWPGDTVPFDRFIAPRIEVELAFVLGMELVAATAARGRARGDLVRHAGDRDPRHPHPDEGPRYRIDADDRRHGRRQRRRRRHHRRPPAFRRARDRHPLGGSGAASQRADRGVGRRRRRARPPGTLDRVADATAGGARRSRCSPGS